MLRRRLEAVKLNGRRGGIEPVHLVYLAYFVVDALNQKNQTNPINLLAVITRQRKAPASAQVGQPSMVQRQPAPWAAERGELSEGR